MQWKCSLVFWDDDLNQLNLDPLPKGENGEAKILLVEINKNGKLFRAKLKEISSKRLKKTKAEN